MSSHFLYVVPRDAEWQPTPEAAARGIDVLKTMAWHPDQISCRFHETIEFFHCGGNWDGVWCPFCDADLEDCFARSLVPEAWTGKRASLDTVTPCCARSTNLNALRFGSPCAFGRFAIEGRDAGAVPDADDMKRLEAAVGAPLIDVWQRI